jgi:Protein of unknown function (DUF3179)
VSTRARIQLGVGLRPLALMLLVLALAGCGGGDDASKSEPDAPAGLRVSADEWRTDFSRHTVPLDQFLAGGPGKDGIPAIDDPRFLPALDVDFLDRKEPVVELVLGGQARAYPIQILIWHEIVNDEVAGTPVAVTFCPLCNTSLVFDRRVDGRTLDFGTTGNLRNSDLVMYDRQTESWWQQFGGAGLVGRYAGRRLEIFPSRIVAWQRFRREHQRGLVLSRDTGHSPPYGQNPYEGYDEVQSGPIFPTEEEGGDRLPKKERVVFVERGGEAVAVPFSTLAERRVIRIVVGGHRFVVSWRPGVASALDRPSISQGRDVGTAEVRENGKLVEFDQPFWFAVAAFRPKVRIIR